MNFRPHISFLYTSVCVFLVLFYAGCGGGSGGSSSSLTSETTFGEDAGDEDTLELDTGEADVLDDVSPEDVQSDVAQEDALQDDTIEGDTLSDEDAADDIDTGTDTDTGADAEEDVSTTQARIAILNPTEGVLLEELAFVVTARYDLGDVDERRLAVRIYADGVSVGRAVLQPEELTGTASVSVRLPHVGPEGQTLHLVAVLEAGAEGSVAQSETVTVRFDPHNGAFNRLRERSNANPPEVRYTQGTPRYAWVETPVDGSSPVDRAWNFLDEFGGLFGIQNPRGELRIAHTASSEDREGNREQSVHMRQDHRGIPVQGAGLTIHMKDDVVYWLRVKHADDLPDVDPNTRITFGHIEAEERAQEFFPGTNPTPIGRPTLVWYDADISTPELDRTDAFDPSTPQLAWIFYLTGIPEQNGSSSWKVTVSAETGELIRRTPLEETENDSGADIEVFNARDQSADLINYSACGLFLNPPLPRQCTEGGCSENASPTAQNLRTLFHNTYSYFDQNLGWQSWDDQDDQLKGYVNVSFGGFPNAMFVRVCDMTLFHDDLVLPDIVAHEFMHGVVYNTLSSPYENSPGALNESLADVFGALVESQDDGENFDRGRFCDLGGLRNLCNPSRTNPNIATPDPEDRVRVNHVSAYCSAPQSDQCKDDHGRVHTNSGIMNIVGALLAGAVDGNRHPYRGEAGEIVVRPIGVRKLADLWFNILRHEDIGEDDGLTAMCRAAQDRARFYARGNHYGFTQEDVCSVVNACAGSGFNDPDLNCDGVSDLRDIDGDNIPDLEDNCPDDRNFHQLDLDADGRGDRCDDDEDGDGVPNEEDNCPRIQNASQVNFDEQGTGDACDDTDGDGVLDRDDNCPDVWNQLQSDIDADRIGDLCDPDRDNDGILDDGDGSGSHTDNPCVGTQAENCDDNCISAFSLSDSSDDDDLDGVGKGCDNCLNVFNPDQRDIDNDRQGDLCDLDADGDRILVLEGRPTCTVDASFSACNDNCPLAFNPSQYDGNNNGIGSACDLEEQNDALTALIDGQTIVYEIGNLMNGTEIPLWVCAPGDCDAGPGETPYFEILVTADADMYWVLVDESGAVVNRPAFVDTVDGIGLQFSFEPSYDAYSYAFSPQPFVGTSYFLRPYLVGSLEEPTVTINISAQQLQSRSARPATCGNDRIEETEVCDNDTLGNASCSDAFYIGGDVSCAWDCQLDTSGCTLCSNQSQCNTEFGLSCLASGQCGMCEVDADCPEPFPCLNGECRLN